MQPVGFEPTPPKRLRPKRSALDHSAKTANKNIYYIYFLRSYRDSNSDCWIQSPE